MNSLIFDNMGLDFILTFHWNKVRFLEHKLSHIFVHYYFNLYNLLNG